jgi:hypothetical protein
MRRVLEYFDISTQLTNVLGTHVKNCLQCVFRRAEGERNGLDEWRYMRVESY